METQIQHWQLQKIEGVLKLVPDKEEVQKVPKKQQKRKQAIAQLPKAPKYRKVKALEIQMKGWGKPIRAKRERKKVNYKQ